MRGLDGCHLEMTMGLNFFFSQAMKQQVAVCHCCSQGALDLVLSSDKSLLYIYTSVLRSKHGIILNADSIKKTTLDAPLKEL